MRSSQDSADATRDGVGTTKVARQRTIVSLLQTTEVRSQQSLGDLLADAGLHVTQATLSRDLVELGAYRVRAADGSLIYAVANEGGDRSLVGAQQASVFTHKLVRLCEELLVSAEANGELVVLRTPPGAAQFLASAVDQASLHEIMGCIAGDDTVLVIARSGSSGAEIAQNFLHGTWADGSAGTSSGASTRASTVTGSSAGTRSPGDNHGETPNA